MLAGGAAERKVAFAVGAVERVLGDVEFAEGTGSQFFGGVVLLHRPASDALDTCLELGRDLVNVFWPNQHARLLVSLLLETSLRTFSDARCHDVGHVLRELGNVLAHANQ